MRAAQEMYKDAVSKVTLNNEYSNKFGVQVGVQWGMVISLFLLIIVLQATMEEFKTSCPQETLYTSDLVHIAERAEIELKFQVRKQNQKSNCLKAN